MFLTIELGTLAVWLLLAVAAAIVASRHRRYRETIERGAHVERELMDTRAELAATKATLGRNAESVTRMISALADAAPAPSEPFYPHRRQVFDRLRLVMLDAFGQGISER